MKANALFGDARALLYTFLGLRLALLIAHQPLMVDAALPVERGLTVYGDYRYHFGVAEGAARGALPYRDYWYEYPPALPLLSQAAYIASRGDYTAYANALSALLTAFDAASLLLVRWLAIQLYGAEDGPPLAWLYALAAAPLIVLWWNFEAVITFSILAALVCLMRRRETLGALLIAFGALVKLVPLLVLAVAWRFRPALRAVRMSALALAITALGLGAVLLIGASGGYGWPSLAAQLAKPSYQTVWALLDGNTATGAFSGDRFDVRAALQPIGAPPRLPPLLRTALFGGLAVAIFTTWRRYDAFGLVCFAALTLLVFYLWSPGWSVQWQAPLVPLVLLALPSRSGVLLCAALAAVSFAEYPALYVRFAGDGPGTLSAQGAPYLTITVLARTALLVAMTVLIWQEARGERIAQA